MAGLALKRPFALKVNGYGIGVSALEGQCEILYAMSYDSEICAVHFISGLVDVRVVRAPLARYYVH